MNDETAMLSVPAKICSKVTVILALLRQKHTDWLEIEATLERAWAAAWAHGRDPAPFRRVELWFVNDRSNNLTLALTEGLTSLCDIASGQKRRVHIYILYIYHVKKTNSKERRAILRRSLATGSCQCRYVWYYYWWKIRRRQCENHEIVLRIY